MRKNIMGKPKPSWIGVKEVRDSKAGEVILKSKVFPPGTWSRDKHEEKCSSGCEKHAQCYTQVIMNNSSNNLDESHRFLGQKGTWCLERLRKKVLFCKGSRRVC